MSLKSSLSVVALESNDTQKVRDYLILLTIDDLTNAIKLLTRVKGYQELRNRCTIVRLSIFYATMFDRIGF